MVAITREPYSPMWHELTTMVIFGPTDFQMDDYKGNMANWQDFGKFVYTLKQGRDQLPDNVKQTVHQAFKWCFRSVPENCTACMNTCKKIPAISAYN